MADKGGLQLLPETRKKIEVKVPGENRLIIIGAILCIAVLILYGSLLWYGSNLSDQVSADDAQLTALDQARNKPAEQALLTLSKQLAVTAQIVKSHIYWSTGFSKIEAALQQNVQFESFSGIVGDSSVRFRATSDNYSTIAKQLAAFVADGAIKDITLDGVSVLTNGKLDFNAKITFDPAKFLTLPK